MEKDNIKNFFKNLAKNSFKKGFCLAKNSINIIDNIVSRISKFDDASNLRTRVVSGLVMLFVAIIAICFSKSLFYFLAVTITILMTFEWLDLTKNAVDARKWHLIGFLYIVLPVFAVLKLRDLNSSILLWMFAVICATDIFAYFVGKNFGGPKLIPQISPNKTWSGLLGGVAASAFIGLISSSMFVGSALFFVFISVLLSLIEQAGDILESSFKRNFGVKDSSKIIPGHGGVLDRLDGMMLVAPIVLFLVFVYSDSFAVK